MKTLHEYFSDSRTLGYKEDELTWQAERRRAQTDLFWLAKEILGFDLVDNFICWDHPKNNFPDPGPCPDCGQPLSRYSGIEGRMSIHREMCNFFVHKNPDLNIPNQDAVKDRLLMCSRGSFKSSVDQADAVQWIIAFPNIRIAIQSATEPLGVEFVQGIRKFFVVDEDDPQATRFQLLFPEHCISSKKKESEEQFTTPARTDTKLVSPTVHAISLKASTSGWHYDVGKNDDCVSNANSGPTATPDQREAIAQMIRLARYLIEPYGYHENIGTPYDENDAYARQMQREGIRLLRRGAWERKPNVSPKKRDEELTPEDVTLLFPVDSKGYPRLTFKTLRAALLDDSHIFSCQLLCSPSSTRVARFTPHLLKSRITQAEGLPQVYRSFAAWDLAYSVEKGRDFSVGCVGWLDMMTLRMFVVEIVRGRFNKADLAYQIAKQAAKWKVEKIRIENSPGAEFLENDIRRQLIQQSNSDCPIEFFPVDAQKGAKNARAEQLETRLNEGTLWFSAAIPIMDEVIHEFVVFTPNSKRKDDIVDAIAHLCAFVPTSAEIPQSEQDRQNAALEILVQKNLHEMLYPGYVPPPPPAQEIPTVWEGSPVACPNCGMTAGYCGCR